MSTGLADQLAYAEEARRVAEQLAAARLAEINTLKKRLKVAEKAQAAAEQRVSEGELVRRKLHNTILVGPPAALQVQLEFSGGGNFSVCAQVAWSRVHLMHVHKSARHCLKRPLSCETIAVRMSLWALRTDAACFADAEGEHQGVLPGATGGWR